MRSARTSTSASLLPVLRSFGASNTSEMRSGVAGSPRTLACSKVQSAVSDSVPLGVGDRHRPGHLGDDQRRLVHLRDREDLARLDRDGRALPAQLDGRLGAAQLDAERIAADRARGAAIDAADRRLAADPGGDLVVGDARRPQPEAAPGERQQDHDERAARRSSANGGEAVALNSSALVPYCLGGTGLLGERRRSRQTCTAKSAQIWTQASSTATRTYGSSAMGR